MIRFIKKTILTVLFILIKNASYSSAAFLLSLQESIKLGLENNLQIITSNNEYIKSTHKNTIKTFFPNLSTSLDTRFAYNTLESKYKNSSSLTLSIPINPIDKFFSYKKTSIEYRIKKAEALTTTIKLIKDIAVAYYRVVLDQQTLDVRKKSMEVSEHQKDEIKSMYDLGRESKLRYASSLIQYNNDSSTYSHQEDALANAKLTLCTLIGKKLKEDFYVENTILLSDFIGNDMAKTTTASSPQLIVKQHYIDMADMKLTKLWSKLLPTVNANIGYNLNNESKKWTKNLTLGISAKLNIYDMLNLGNEIQCGNIDLDTSISEIATKNLQLEMELKNTIEFYNKQKIRYKLAQDNLKLSQDTFTMVQEQYRLGQIPLLEYKEAKKNAESAELNVLTIVHQMKISELNICNLVGDKDLLLKTCI